MGGVSVMKNVRKFIANEPISRKSHLSSGATPENQFREWHTGKRERIKKITVFNLRSQRKNLISFYLSIK